MKPQILVAACVAVFGAASATSAQLPPVPTPAGNPTTPDKVLLGKALFWDEQVSSTNTVACGTCHRPDAGGTDPRASFSINPGFDGVFGTADDVHGSPGVPLHMANGDYAPSAFGLHTQVTGRAAPSAINAAFNDDQFWDGRVNSVFKDPLTGQVALPSSASLESQAANPPVGDAEMANQGRTWSDVAAKVAASRPLALASNVPNALDAFIHNRTYADLFTQVYGDPAVTPVRILMAIGAYERTLIADQTPFDRNTMTPQQQLGFNVFSNKGRCVLCHDGVLTTDKSYHNIGVRPVIEDVGRFKVTQNPLDRGAFKTPGLRNVGLRTAFMHNGEHHSLSEVIEFYDRGGDFFDNLDPAMQPLGLTLTEKIALLDFLTNALTDPRVAAKQAPFDPPTLYTQTVRLPDSYLAGGSSNGGAVPELIAIEPPMLGNRRMTIALANAQGGAMGTMAIDAFQGIGLPFLGVPIMVARSPALTMLAPVVLNGSGASGGYWSWHFAVPSAPALTGVDLYFQGFAVDPAAAALAGSQGVHIKFFAPH